MLERFVTPRHLLSLLLLTATLIILQSCGEETQGIPPSAPVQVDFEILKPVSAQVESKYPGSIEGKVNVDIKAQITGYLDNIYVKEGDYVQKGQTLFKIKGDVYNAQVRTSEAMLNAALSAEENARIELEKIKPLVAGKVVSEVQLKTAEANYAAAKAQVAQARSALGSSQINADFALIKAPVSGYIGRIPNRVGNLVTPADMVPLTTLSEIDEVFVYFSLSEADFISFTKDRKTDAGMNTVELIMADGTFYEQKGKLEIASGNIDRSTGSISLKAVFSNPDKILRSGGSGKIVLKKEMKNVLTLPMACVKDIQDKYFVYVLGSNNSVQMKPIEIKGTSGNNYIVESGLKAGEKVALNRIDVLFDGMPVVPQIRKS
ncbi:efflux RND transporter periplasmic adaptor subunit [Fluviicola sp.]|uniref:efflux RND transporter periplasmic adaptor subunit n=1 Tax=Fluviicola sp. TaxID=1917219 RepID=UPI00261F6FB6|nr:efflux RND transporter periplasmic adaptor subunit [Fluviicola sp.]